MARIRSIHPGMMTDENFMALSLAARICVAGVWMEADDHGVFEWKPLTLKARIFPADAVDVAALLAELETHQWVKRFEVEGKVYGVCRNFRKWQRPKKPTYSHPFPEEFASYIALKAQSSPPVENQFSTTSPKSQQMEDGGGRMEKKDTGSAEADGQTNFEDEAVKAYNDLAEQLSWPKCEKISTARRSKLRARLRDCGGIDGWYRALAKAKGSAFLRGETNRGPGHANWRPDLDFFLQESKFLKLTEGGYDGATTPPAVTLSPATTRTPDDWRAALKRFQRDGYWPMSGYGPQPGYGGCVVPVALLQEFGLAQGAA